MTVRREKNKTMTHIITLYPEFIFILWLAGMVLANRNKALNERQTRNVPCEVNVTRQRLHYH
jgi:hypothetical protein